MVFMIGIDRTCSRTRVLHCVFVSSCCIQRLGANDVPEAASKEFEFMILRVLFYSFERFASSFLVVGLLCWIVVLVGIHIEMMD